MPLALALSKLSQRAYDELALDVALVSINRAAQSFAPESSALGKKHTQIVGPVSG